MSIQVNAQWLKAVEKQDKDLISSLNEELKGKETHEERVARAKVLWVQFGNVPCNEDNELDEDWLFFTEYDDVIDIQRWFEDFFDISVAEDLMYVN